MGANAQTTVPTFTASQVLTADQMNQSARTGVPVFADTTARDAAFGGTGEKTLAEGQLCYVENLTGDAQLQYYDGSTWNSLGEAGLTLVSSTTIGSAVSSVTVSNAFSSNYDNYLITINGGVASTDNTLNMTLGSTTANYRYNVIYMVFTSATATGLNSNSAANWLAAAEGSANALSGQIMLQNPFLAKNTIAYYQSIRSASGGEQVIGWGALNDTTSHTAFTLTTNTGTITGGTIRVYGYRN